MSKFDAGACVVEVRERLAAARHRVGSSATLLAYDANAIQAFLAASDRLHAMRGASALVKAFDGRALTVVPGAGLFGGGGRGLLLLKPEEVEATAARLVEDYRATTFGGALAVATATLAGDEAASLRLLRARLDVAKDAAPPPASTLVERPDDHSRCQDCHTRPVDHPRQPRRDETVAICTRCRDLYAEGVRVAGDEDERGLTFEDLTVQGVRGVGNRIATLSADGNEMGRLFGGLETLEAQALASEAVARIFAGAVGAAQAAADAAYVKEQTKPRGQVTPVAGGDDIRAFVGPEVALPYVEALVERLEADLDHAGDRLDLPEAAADAFAHIGLGGGLLVAPFGLPARRLLDLAHGLEREAKKKCGAGAARSGFRVAFLRSGDELSGGDDRRTAERARELAKADRAQDRRSEVLVHSGAVPDGARPWRQTLDRARALAKVPRAQRSVLRQRDAMEPGEWLNLFRYQVARNEEWRRYYAAVGDDWRTLPAEQPDARIPSWTEQELARLVQLENDAFGRDAK